MSGRTRPKTTSTRPSPRPSRGWWRPALIVVAGFLAYSNSLTGPFVFDDVNSIVTNAAVHRLANVVAVFSQRETPIAGRPVVALSFALNYTTSGLWPPAYHLTNIAVHVLCALLLFGIVRRTLELPRFADRFRHSADTLALAVGLIWTVHPLNTEAVDYLTERTESLMAFFFLLTLYAAVRSATCRRKGMWAVVAVVSCALGMGCKESMVVAPAIVFVYDRIFLFGSLGETFAARWRLYGALAVTWLFLAYLMLPGPRLNSVGASDTVQPWMYFLNQAQLISRYMRLAIWPGDLVVNYGPAVALHVRDVVPQGMLIVALLLATLAALRWRPEAGFVGAWVFITLAPTSSFIPIATEVGAERRMYLPLMGIISLLVVGAYSLDPFRRRWSRSGALWTLVAVSLALGAATWMRNREYASGLSLAESVLRRWPTDLAHGMVGSELSALRRNDEAIRELRIAARTDPRSRLNLGITLFNSGKYDEAIYELKAYADEHPLLGEVPMARRVIAHAFSLQHNWTQAANQLTLVLSMTPRDADARTLLVQALNNQGLELAAAGKFGQAAVPFRRAVALDPRRLDVRHNLAAALFDNHDPVAAEQEARQAIAFSPTDAGSYNLLGRALAVQGKMDEAVAQLDHALKLAPDNPQIQDDLRRVKKSIASSPSP